MTLADVCEMLVDNQRKRVFCITSQSRCDRSAEAFIARFAANGRGDMTPEQRKAMWKDIAALRKKIEAGEDAGGTGEVRDAIITIVLQSAAAREGWDRIREKAEADMRALARQLPVYPWVKEVKGFGDLGLAIIVGEAGDLSRFDTVSKLWKRLGLAVIHGQRQGNPGPGADAAAWTEHGYSKKRRAQVWAMLSDSMFRHQWRGAREDAPAHPIGPYGEVYGRRKASTAYRGWTDKHRDNDARRVMSKALLADLWGEWRKASR